MSNKEEQLLGYWAISTLIKSKELSEKLTDLQKTKLSRSLRKMSKSDWPKLSILAVKLSSDFEEIKLDQRMKELFPGICHGVQLDIIDGVEGMYLYEIRIRKGQRRVIRAFEDD